MIRIFDYRVCRPELRLKTTNTSLNFYSIYIYTIQYNQNRERKYIQSDKKFTPRGRKEGRKEPHPPIHPKMRTNEMQPTSLLESEANNKRGKNKTSPSEIPTSKRDAWKRAEFTVLRVFVLPTPRKEHCDSVQAR